MKRIKFITFFLIIAFIKGYSQNPSLDITYLGNEGFLIYSKNKKVLVDALFKSNSPSYLAPSDTMIKSMISGVLPYNKIDLLFITHYHGDHFNADLTLKFLENQTTCKLVANKQVVDQMRSLTDFDKVGSRIIEISSDTCILSKIVENSIDIDIINTKHNRDENTKNLTFIVNLEGTCFFHCGDAPIKDNIQALLKYDFSKKPIDIMFLQSYDTSFVTKQFIAKKIKPDMIIAMHISPEVIEKRSKTFMNHYPFGKIFRKQEQSLHFINSINYQTLLEPYLGVNE